MQCLPAAAVEGARSAPLRRSLTPPRLGAYGSLPAARPAPARRRGSHGRARRRRFDTDFNAHGIWLGSGSVGLQERLNVGDGLGVVAEEDDVDAVGGSSGDSALYVVEEDDLVRSGAQTLTGERVDTRIGYRESREW